MRPTMESSNYPQYLSEPQPTKLQSLYDGRIRQFTDTGGQYHDLNLPHFYDRQRIDKEDNVKLEVYDVPNLQRPSFKDAVRQAKWRQTSKGNDFGPSWSTHWFRINLRIPNDWEKAEKIIFEWDCGDEGMLYTNDGLAVIGLSGEQRKEWNVPSEWRDGKWHQFYIETACNNMQGLGSPPDPNRYFRLNRADLVIPHLDARALYIDFWIIGDASREFPGDSWQKHQARQTLNKIIDTFDRENPDQSIKKCRQIAEAYIGEHVNSSDVYKHTTSEGQISHEACVYALGNCHIDTAWLWPFAETHRKIGRSWASQLDLLERYPEYIFVASQMQQFRWLSEDYPDIFDRVVKATKGGRFIPIGGSWVECDTNMPSGEAILRQFLLGQRFMEANFGFRSRTFWLPDTFGYSPQIPQLCRLGGMDRFLTQKLSWNNINTYPNTTFNWVALDGTQVMVHMPPANTYTASAHFGDVKRSLSQHKNLDTDTHGMLLYGHGDGGGGPTSEMLEKLRRCRGISNTVGLLPRVEMPKTVDQFYDAIEEKSHSGKDLVTWVGELYLEFHRGTYTTQAAIKKGNRMSEIMMHDVELLATLASMSKSKKEYRYPTARIDELWEKICLNQFHDVLPGSGIEMIYEDARAIYVDVKEKAEALIKEALEAIGLSLYATNDSQKLGALNTLPWARSEIIQVPAGSRDVEQRDKFGGLIRVEGDGPGLLCKVATQNKESKSDIPTVSAIESEPGVFELKNDRLRITVEGGALTSVWDYQAKREVLANGKKGNQLVMFDDQPLSFPAWDTELYSLDSRKELSPGKVKILQNGPLRAALEVEHQISSKSRIRTTISLDACEKKNQDVPCTSYIVFECEVDWHETYQFLKVEFPVDVRNDHAAYETQFGYQKRPTHYNTTWDVAKFEVCGQKWADLSDYSYGATIINDCKYGYSIHGNMMRLSLLRSPKSPDANADMGTHHFRYAFLPHIGGLSPEVVRAAFNFNYPLKNVFFDESASGVQEEMLKSFTIIGSDALVLNTVKRFEDDEDVSRKILPIRGARNSKSVIVRVYESMGGMARGCLVSKYPIAKVFKCNSLEDDLEQMDILSSIEHDSVPIELKGFEVATYRIELAQ